MMPTPRTFPPSLRLWPLVLVLLLCLPVAANARHPSGGKRPERPRFTEVFDANGQIGPVYYPAYATPGDPERKAAEELAHYLEKISGHAWDVLPEPPSLTVHGLFVGRTRRAFVDGLWRANDPHAPLQLPTDRIELAAAPGRISLVGENPQATLSGVYRFLETYAGVRWYAPGELGEEVPSPPRLRLRQGRSHWQPSFRDRIYYASVPNPDFYLWARRIGASGHFSSNHNLHRIFTPELYNEHPEYWAQVGGKRKGPGKNERTSQLDYTNPEVARLTAQAARAALDADPRRLSFSLGINDAIDFGDDAATLAAISPLRYRHGHPVFSDLVFDFANAAARAIGQTHPDRYLPVLAYMWAEEVPGFTLEPNLMPYLCLDHAQWYDPQRRLADMELTRRWAQSGAREFGSWEYYYGNGFFIPRIFNRITAESLKFIHAEGFRSIFMESGSNIGFDASKMWLATQLIWDIDADPSALLRDFYHGYYGAAGATMQELFEYCERIWMEQEGHAYWLKYFLNPNQATLYPPQALRQVQALLARARGELDAAHAPERFYLRLQQTAANFAYLQAVSRYYHIYTELLTMPLDSVPDVRRFLRLDNAFAAARQALKQAPPMQLREPWQMRPQLLQLRPGGRLAAVIRNRPQLVPANWSATDVLADWNATDVPTPCTDSAPAATAQPIAGTAPAATTQPAAGTAPAATTQPAAGTAPAQPSAAQPATGVAPLLTPGQIFSAANARLLMREDFSTELIAGDTTGFAPQRSLSGPLPSGWNLRWTHHQNARLLRHRTAAAKDTIATGAADQGWQLSLSDQEFVSLFRWIELPEGAALIGTQLQILGTLSPGCQVRISLGWLDANHKPVGENNYNLLPPRSYANWQDFAIAAERPEAAAWVYIGIRLQQQAPAETLHLRNWETFYWQTEP